MNFCKVSYTLLKEVTSGDKLEFKSDKTGTTYKAEPSHTMLVNQGVETGINKFKFTLSTSAYDPTNPKERIPDGCEKCKRKVVSLQRLGVEKKVVYSCLCGNSWST